MFNWLTKKKRSLENPAIPLSEAYDLLVNNPSITGFAVSPTSILGNPAVWRAINLISNKVATVPLELYKREDNGSRSKAYSHPAYKLLRKRASISLTAFDFKRVLTSHSLIHGNGYAAINRNDYGLPIELSILDPMQTQAKTNSDGVYYETRINNRTFRLAYSDVFHIKNLSPDGLTGYSMLDIMKDSLGLGLSLQRYGAVFFRNNCKPNQYVEIPPAANTQEKANAWIKGFLKELQGASNGHKTGFLPKDTKVTFVPINNDEGQWMQSREFDLLSVSNIFGIPASYLGSQVNTSYSSLEMDSQNLLANCLEFHLSEWEAEAEHKLLSERAKDRGTHYYEFNRKKLIQIDEEKKDKLINDKFINGRISFVEMREEMNMSVDKNLDDGWYHQTNTVQELPDTQPAPVPATASVTAAVPQQEQPAPVVVDQNQQQNQQDQQPPQQNQRFKDMTTKTIERLVTRCQKAAEAGKLDMLSHRSVWSDSLSMFNKDDLIESTLQNLEDELKEVLPEQRQSVFERLNVDDLVNGLMETK